MFWWDVRNIGNGSELVSCIVSSLLQILVSSCSVLTATDHGMLTLAHFPLSRCGQVIMKFHVFELCCVCFISVFFQLHFQCLYLRQFRGAQNFCTRLPRHKFCTVAPNILV